MFDTMRQNVFRLVKHAVSWSLAYRDVDGIESIGVDEVQWQRGHKYLTLVYPIHEIRAGRGEPEIDPHLAVWQL